MVFRVDASLQIGTGHVMRCLTLADALTQHGADCCFICREHTGNLIDLIRNRGYLVDELAVQSIQDADTVNSSTLMHAAWLGASPQQDAKACQPILQARQPDWLVVDHYALDATWETELRPYCKKLMVIDDLADRNHDCDLLLDQNLVADLNCRYDPLIPIHSARLLGPEFALLQPQYAHLHPRTPPRILPIQRLLVFFGGTDPYNLTSKAISAFLALERSDLIMDVVIHSSAPHADEIRKQVKSHNTIVLHETLPSLALLMLKADVAIGAGGATSWERCCLGLPSLVITLAENQKPIAAELNRHGLIRWLGHANEVSVSMLRTALADLCAENDITDWSQRCMTWVDGKGTQRVAASMMLNANTQLRARLARADDEVLILRWANDPLVRCNAFNSDPIAAENHRVWFYKRLRNPESCRIYIIETADERLPIGQVRFEYNEHASAWEIHYGLDSIARNRKLGAVFLQTAMQAFRNAIGHGALVLGQVKADNIPSRKVFKNLGFKSNTEGGGGRLSIAVCSDASSWMNDFIPKLLLELLASGHRCLWTHTADALTGGDLCFYLSYGRIVDRTTLEKYSNNLVVHASDLPKGRGWSPTSWMILEGKRHIPVTLLEAVEKVDAGSIYAQKWLTLEDVDLVNEWRTKLANTTVQLIMNFVTSFPDSLKDARIQEGDLTYYPKRFPKEELSRFAPTIFIHLAATFERSAETYEFWEQNYWNNIRLSHHLMTLFKDISSLKKVVFASSYLIYDPSLYIFSQPSEKPVQLSEKQSIAPRNLTGMAKLAHEIELRFLSEFRSSQFTSVSVRIFLGYGCNSKDVISRWIRSALRGETLSVYCPEGMFDYIYAADTAEGLVRIAKSSNILGVINLGTGKSRKIYEILNILKSNFENLKIEYSKNSNPSYEASCANMSLFSEKMGWMPVYNLEKAIPEIIKFERSRLNFSYSSFKFNGNILVSSASKKIPLICSIVDANKKIASNMYVYAGDINHYAHSQFFCNGLIILPETIENNLQNFLKIFNKKNIKIIIPTRDGELEFWSRNKYLFQSYGISVLVSEPEAISISIDKLAFAKFGKANNLPIIPAWKKPLGKGLFVVKERYGAGSRSIGLKLNAKSALKHGSKLSDPIYQPFVEGTEISADAWLNKHHKVKGIVLRERNEVVNGESVVTTTFKNPSLESECIKILEMLPLQGSVVLQLIIDKNNNIHIIELNARFGGASTASIAAGLDVWYWTLMELNGEDLDSIPFQRSDLEVRQVRVPQDIIIHDFNV